MKTVLLQEAERCVALSWRGTAAPALPLCRTMHDRFTQWVCLMFEDVQRHSPLLSAGSIRHYCAENYHKETKLHSCLHLPPTPRPRPRACKPLSIVSVPVKGQQCFCSPLDYYRREMSTKQRPLVRLLVSSRPVHVHVSFQHRFRADTTLCCAE